MIKSTSCNAAVSARSCLAGRLALFQSIGWMPGDNLTYDDYDEGLDSRDRLADGSSVAGGGQGQVGGIAVDERTEVGTAVDLAERSQGAIEAPVGGWIVFAGAGIGSQLPTVVLDRDRENISQRCTSFGDVFADRVEMPIDQTNNRGWVRYRSGELIPKGFANLFAASASQPSGDMHVAGGQLDCRIESIVRHRRQRFVFVLRLIVIELFSQQRSPRFTRRCLKTKDLAS